MTNFGTGLLLHKARVSLRISVVGTQRIAGLDSSSDNGYAVGTVALCMISLGLLLVP
jgi:hypothetical protein